jgi:hypothetical protein
MNKAVPTDQIPKNLRGFEYPENLFVDVKSGEFDAGADEQLVRMAKYAVMREARLELSDGKLVKIARDESEEPTFLRAIRRARSEKYGNSEGHAAGDIELIADTLDVYEIIWPFDEAAMQQAAEEEAQAA